jgi:enterobacteria phage integrase
MPPKLRKAGNRALPDNLYTVDTAGTRYRYKHPVTGRFHGMGSDRTKAIQAARKLNLLLTSPVDLVGAVLSSDSCSIGTCVDRYQNERQLQTGLAPSTLKLENYRLLAIKKDLGYLPAQDFTVKAASEWLDSFTGNAYTKHRGTLVKVLAFAQAKGLVSGNVAEKTLQVAREQERKVRKPLSRPQFNSIRAAAPEWLQVAMDLALITLQRRGDLVNAKYSDIQDGYIRIIQAKTEKHGERAFLRIKIGSGLSSVLERSRQMVPINCPFIVHRLPDRRVSHAGQEHHGQVRGDYLGKIFAEVRDCLPEFQAMRGPTRPTFHEIRGLGGAEYLRQGYSKEYVNLLMGHTSQRMTDSYTGQHINWTDCEAGLNL